MKKQNVKRFFAFLVIASGFFSYAQTDNKSEEVKNEKLVLTVEDAVKYALKNNKTLKSSAIDLEIKKRANMYSWNVFMPTLGVSGTASRTTDIDQYVQNYGYPDEEKTHWSVLGNAGFSWAFNAAMLAQIKLAKINYESGKISYEKSCTEMETNIRKMFYSILLAQENLKINKDSLANAKARYDQAAINYRNGLVPELSLLNTQVTYENQKPAVLKAEKNLDQALDSFAFLLGLPFGTQIELSGKITVKPVKVDSEELVKRYIESSNEINSLKKNIESANFGLKAKRLSLYTPSIALNYNYQPMFYAMGEKKTGSDIKDNGSLSITLAFTDVLGWLPFSSASQSIKDIQRQINQLELAYEMTVDGARVEIHKLVDNLEISKQNLATMEANVELAQKAYNSTLRAFYNGTQEWLSVKESDSQLQQARLGLMNERFNYISAVLDLEQKLNMKISE